MSKLRIHLLIIDMQNDFMDLPKSALAVQGATKDGDRLAALINRLGRKIDDITGTLDSHYQMHIANPMMWVDSQGNRPTPFTQITAAAVNNGVWRAALPGWQKWQVSYVEALERGGRYPLFIWPPHCIIGTPGHNVYEPVQKAINRWEDTEYGLAAMVTKGSNFRTEHYSAVKAEVVDPNDPSTNLNMGLIKTLQESDIILLAGQALSHCVANTVRDIADAFGPNNVEKLHLLRDCTSPVGGFEKLGDDFVSEMKAKGMKVVDSATFMA